MFVVPKVTGYLCRPFLVTRFTLLPEAETASGMAQLFYY